MKKYLLFLLFIPGICNAGIAARCDSTASDRHWLYCTPDEYGEGSAGGTCKVDGTEYACGGNGYRFTAEPGVEREFFFFKPLLNGQVRPGLHEFIGRCRVDTSLTTCTSQAGHVSGPGCKSLADYSAIGEAVIMQGGKVKRVKNCDFKNTGGVETGDGHVIVYDEFSVMVDGLALGYSTNFEHAQAMEDCPHVKKLKGKALVISNAPHPRNHRWVPEPGFSLNEKTLQLMRQNFPPGEYFIGVIVGDDGTIQEIKPLSLPDGMDTLVVTDIKGQGVNFDWRNGQRHALTAIANVVIEDEREFRNKGMIVAYFVGLAACLAGGCP